MAGFGGLVAALAVFLAAHILPAATGLRGRLTRLVGERAYLIAYSALSLALLGWVVAEVVAAPTVPLWRPAPWTYWVPVAGMPIACILLVAGLSQPNPLSIRVRPGRFDPQRPGVLALTRHPVVAAFTLWAALHIPANGDLAATGFFAVVAGFGVLGSRRLDRKRRRQLGPDVWAQLARATSGVPGAALASGPARPAVTAAGLGQVLGGLALYAVLFRLHSFVPGIALPPLLGW